MVVRRRAVAASNSCPGLIIKRKIKIDVLLKEVYNE